MTIIAIFLQKILSVIEFFLSGEITTLRNVFNAYYTVTTYITYSTYSSSGTCSTLKMFRRDIFLSAGPVFTSSSFSAGLSFNFEMFCLIYNSQFFYIRRF